MKNTPTELGLLDLEPQKTLNWFIKDYEDSKQKKKLFRASKH